MEPPSNPSDPPVLASVPAWTPSSVARLVLLWNDRLSAAAIARELGPGFTRNAVVGKLFRLGLKRSDEQRYEAQAQGARHSRRLQRQGANGPAPPRRGPPLQAVPLPPPTLCGVVPNLVDIVSLPRSGCRWPYETGEGPRFCGHRTKSESSYCPAHHSIAYAGTLPPLTLEDLERSMRPFAGQAARSA